MVAQLQKRCYHKNMRDKKDYSIVGEQEVDASGSENWKNYLDSYRLTNAWSTPDGSPFTQYTKLRTINSVDTLRDSIKPRYSEGGKNSENGVDNLIRSGNANQETAIILDLGGAHSVAMAIKLMKQGYQPVIMFDSTPHPDGSTRSEQHLATMLYFASQAEQMKNEGRYNRSSPPVFIMDTHRSAGNSLLGRGRHNNSHEYVPSDLPSSDELMSHGITRVVYVNEGDQDGQINRNYQSIQRAANDIKPVVQSWSNEGLEIKYTGVRPWENDDRLRSSVNP